MAVVHRRVPDRQFSISQLGSVISWLDRQAMMYQHWTLRLLGFAKQIWDLQHLVVRVLAYSKCNKNGVCVSEWEASHPKNPSFLL